MIRKQVLGAALIAGGMLLQSGYVLAAGQTVLYFFSEPGDYIGGGTEVTLTPSDGIFSSLPIYTNGVHIHFDNFSVPNSNMTWWDINASAPNNALLTPGSYENAERDPFKSAGHPGLEFSGSGRGCNTLTGRFDVLELVRDSNNQVAQLAANFEQHCEGGKPALYGQIRYNSSVPLSGKPLKINLQNPLNKNGCVEATNQAGASVKVDAADARDAQGGTQLSYAWTSANGATGTAPTFAFQAPLSSVASTVQLTVKDLTTGASKTVNKAICVSDTTGPAIVINSPQPGATVRVKDLVVDVSIVDAADKNIRSYELSVGTIAMPQLNPATGASRVKPFGSPRKVGPEEVTVTVRAKDASGNASQKSVQVMNQP